jgi:hypothetical protein
MPTYLTSPSAALAYQVGEEVRLELLLSEATRAMLLQVKANALSRALTVASSSDAWTKAVENAIAALENVSASEKAFLQTNLVRDNLGAEAYTTAMAVMKQATETYPAPSKADIEQALDIALDLETPSLTAAGAISKIKNAIINKLTKLGNTWSTRVSRTVRTGYTGFRGFSAIQQLRLFKVPDKQWVTRHDDKVRTTHAEADGQKAPLEGFFRVGEALLSYPGDPDGPLDEIANCRCLIIAGSIPE